MQTILLDANIIMKNYSIIIPHHNIPDLLNRCLTSIPEREDIEIIIIDDNSERGIVDFANFPGKDRNNVKCFFVKEHKGAGYARNIGINKACGKWILFVDADDFLLPNAFEYLDKYINTDYDVILFKSDSCLSEDITQKGKRMHAIHLNTLIDDSLKNKILPQEVLFRILSPWCKLCNREFLVQNNIKFDLTKLGGEDIIWSTDLAIQAQKITISNNKIYCLTERYGSLTSSTFNIDSLKNSINILYRRNILLDFYNYQKYRSFISYHELISIISYSRIKYITYIFKCIHNNVLEPKCFYNIETKLRFKYPYFYFLLAFMNFPSRKKIISKFHLSL